MRLTVIIRTEESKKVLSQWGGLVLPKRAVDSLGLSKIIAPHLPRSGFEGATSPEQKFIGLIYGFLSGIDCLEDMDIRAQDAGFASVTGGVCSSNRYSEFLSKFNSQQLRELQDRLIDTSLAIRKSIVGMDEFTLALDSTKHDQFGLKQEGVEWSYNGHRGFDSLHAYDTHGFPYWYALRSGATHTAQGAEEVVSAVFRKLPSTCKKRLVLADSGYYSKDFFNACSQQNANFIVAMRANVYRSLIDKRSLNWLRCNPDKMRFFDGRAFEYAETVYHPEDCGRTLRVVFVRALREDHEGRLFQDQDYDYAAFATDIGMHKCDALSVLQKYRKRSNAENFVREMKNGINTRRFQFRRLNSGAAFAIAAAFSMSVMRLLAHVAGNKIIQFSKRIRDALLRLPCEVVRHGREVTFRFMSHHHQEVLRWQRNYITNCAATLVPEKKPRSLTTS
jgi:Transposase DDE domain group 1